ncbi:MAG: NAD(P)/FAD-dependent oxidoreductase, partial [Clostridia bacterium]|nr:NAD(P)/FAD-dependent oxidoreductase [Clostridia bacterium]
MKSYKIAIVGGGASGLDLAILLKQRGIDDFVLLERLDRVGKKLISTGNGQGNLTNENLTCGFSSFGGGFYNYAIGKYGNKEINGFYKSIGVMLTSEENGRVYPLSKQASSVLDIMRAYLDGKNAETVTDFYAVSLKEKGDGFIITSSNGQSVYADNVVLCCGGSAGKQYGTDGSSYRLAEGFGHKVTDLYPSLVQLKTETDKIKGLRGLKANAVVKAKDG